MWSPPTARTIECQTLPSIKTATSVVPPPMSTRMTPISFSAGVRTASPAASGPSTRSTASAPAFLTHFTTFCSGATPPVTTWASTSSR